jgi:NADH dehydrogenase
MEIDATKRRVVILGGGFAGAYTALHLEKQLRNPSDVEVLLLAQENFILFTPMLHEVAGADVSVTDIVQPLRKMLRRTRVGIGSIESVDLIKKLVRVRHAGLGANFDIKYEQLVLALGAVTNFYRIPGLQEYALTMKSLGDAILVRNLVIDSLGVADNVSDELERHKSLTVVVAGGGFAGVETAGAVNDLFRNSMRFYPRLKENMIRVVLVHPGECILPELAESLGRYAAKKLGGRGVELRLNTKVIGYNGQEVTLDDGSKLATRMLIWTAGITPPPLISTLACATQHGRVVANECLQVPDWPGVWALGDCALVPDPLSPGKFYPPTAQHATRQAAVLAKNIAGALDGKPPRPFKFKMVGALATIGRRCGVAEIYGLKFSGIIAWWLWRGIYLSKLPGFPKKVRVAIDWMLDTVFSKDIVQLPTLRSPSMSQPEPNAAPQSSDPSSAA